MDLSAPLEVCIVAAALQQVSEVIDHGADLGMLHGAEKGESFVERRVLGMAFEHGMIELVGLVGDGVKDKGRLPEVSEAGEEA